MSRCRCYDIEVVERDLRKLDEMDWIVQKMRSALSQTDEAANSLKSSVEGAVDVSLGGVPADMFSREGRSALSSTQNSLSARKSSLQSMLASYRYEDARYHEEVRMAAIRRAEARRRALQQRHSDGDWTW